MDAAFFELGVRGLLLGVAIVVTFGVVVTILDGPHTGNVREDLLDAIARCLLCGFLWNLWISGL